MTQGRCGGQALCLNDADCDVGFGCSEDGLCVEKPIACEGFGQCPQDFRCDNGQCVSVVFPCSDDQMCGLGNRCESGRCVPPPPVGSCAPDAVISIQTGDAYQGSTVAAPATHSGDGCAGASSLSGEIAHRISPQEFGEHCVRLTQTDFDAFVYVRFGCHDPFGTGCERGQTGISIFGGPGQDVFAFVDGVDSPDGQPSSGTYELTVTEGACPECGLSSDCEAGRVCVDGRCMLAPDPGAVILTELVLAPADERSEGTANGLN